MRIHRSAHQRFFTTLGNDVLRDNRLSFCARGIIAHLLSQPDGKRDDIRTLTERTPEGRERVASAMRELERFGYIKRAKKRTPEGRLYTEVDVFETPLGLLSEVAPSTGFPASGGSTGGQDGGNPVNERGQEPTLPPPPLKAKARGGGTMATKNPRRALRCWLVSHVPSPSWPWARPKRSGSHLWLPSGGGVARPNCTSSDR